MVDKPSSEVITKIRSVTATKSDENSNRNTPVVFNFGVNMDEADRKNDSVKLNFQMTMDTDPSIVKFMVEGSALIQGEVDEIEKILAPDGQTGVPHVFTRIYQEVYAVIFLLAGNLDVPYPSPALLKRTQVRASAYPDQIQQ